MKTELHDLNSSHGKLIVIEGPENTGKSTLAEMLAKRLTYKGVRVKKFSYPGKEPFSLGALVYSLEHQTSEIRLTSISSSARQAMHLAAHLDLIEKKILPSISRGEWVVLDRFWWSLWTHGRSDGLSEDFLNKLIEVERFTWGNISPEVIFCTTRDSPFTEPISETWIKVREFYEQLANKEQQSMTIEVLPQSENIEDRVDRCFTRLANIFSLSL